jgi:hypothetical protein
MRGKCNEEYRYSNYTVDVIVDSLIWRIFFVLCIHKGFWLVCSRLQSGSGAELGPRSRLRLCHQVLQGPHGGCGQGKADKIQINFETAVKQILKDLVEAAAKVRRLKPGLL